MAGKGNLETLVSFSDMPEEKHKEASRKGGIKSGETRRAKKNAKQTIQYLLELMPTGATQVNMKEMGISEEEMTYQAALWAKTLDRYLKTGDLKLLEALMRYGGYDDAEARKDRESDARIRAMDKSGIPVAGESESKNEVMIILPDDGRGAPGATEITQEQADELSKKE